jgi:hypothetical protein
MHPWHGQWPPHLAFPSASTPRLLLGRRSHSAHTHRCAVRSHMLGYRLLQHQLLPAQLIVHVFAIPLLLLLSFCMLLLLCQPAAAEGQRPRQFQHRVAAAPAWRAQRCCCQLGAAWRICRRPGCQPGALHAAAAGHTGHDTGTADVGC